MLTMKLTHSMISIGQAHFQSPIHGSTFVWSVGGIKCSTSQNNQSRYERRNHVVCRVLNPNLLNWLFSDQFIFEFWFLVSYYRRSSSEESSRKVCRNQKLLLITKAYRSPHEINEKATTVTSSSTFHREGSTQEKSIQHRGRVNDG